MIFLFAATIFSCSDDEAADVLTTSDLIGEWQRSDVDNDFEYKLIFNADNTGYRSQREGSTADQGISTLSMFNWSTDGRILKFDFDGELITTAYSINTTGQLLLSDFTDLFFIKLE